jgi:glycosyltransferase involved in cell wall biosynthesis
MINTNKRICVLSFSNIARDGRVLRQIHFAMRAGFQVDVIGFGNWEAPPGVVYYSLPQTNSTSLNILLDWISLLLGKITPRFWEIVFWRNREYCQARDILMQQDYDLVHANDWDSLPVAGYVSKLTHVPVLYDAHEYTLEQEKQMVQKRLLRKPYQEYLLRSYGVYISKMITVSDGIRDLYEGEFGWRSMVIRNTPSYEKHEFRKVSPNKINLIHHGCAIKGRNIEAIIQMMADLDERYCLYLMLVQNDVKYYKKLKSAAESVAPERIKFLPPVAPVNITDTINKFDIGIFLLKALNLSYYHTLPNKLFDFVMAGLAVAVYPLPDMIKIIRENNIGIVSKKPSKESMADALNSLEPSEIESFKANSLTMAKKLNAETELEKLIGLYKDIIRVG